MLQRRLSGENAELIALPPASPLLFVISGPSGVGKDALVDQLRQREAGRHYAITATTRAPRTGEVNEVHYHFRTSEQFQGMIDNGELLEWAKVYEQSYGVPKFELGNALAANLDVVLKVDVQGATSIKKGLPQAILIFLAPYSYEELLQRHFRRRTESGWELNLRLETARKEMAAMDAFDYVVTNKQGELVHAVNQLEGIIQAEKCRAQPRSFSI